LGRTENMDSATALAFVWARGGAVARLGAPLELH